MKYLKQSTSTVIIFGPTLNPTDGVTLITSLVSALDHASTGIFIYKNGGGGAVRHASVTATTYSNYGNYLVTLDTTDTNTLGRLRVMFAAAASCLPVWEDFTVLTANIFDSLIGGTDLFDVSVTQLLGTAWLTPGVAGTPDVNAKLVGATAQTGRDIGASVLLSSGTGTGQVSLSSGLVTLAAVTHTGAVIPTVTVTTTATNLVNAASAGDFTATMKTSLSAATPAVTISDKTGFSLATAPPTAAQVRIEIDSNSTKLDAAITSRSTAADVRTQVDAALDASGAELVAIPTTVGSVRQKLNFLFQYFRNKRTVSSSTETLLKEDATTPLGISLLSDDGATFTKGEAS